MAGDFSSRALPHPNRPSDLVLGEKELEDVKQLRFLSDTLPAQTVARYVSVTSDGEERETFGYIRGTERKILAAGERLAVLAVPNLRGRYPAEFIHPFPSTSKSTKLIELWFPASDPRYRASPPLSMGDGAPSDIPESTSSNAPADTTAASDSNRFSDLPSGYSDTSGLGSAIAAAFGGGDSSGTGMSGSSMPPPSGSHSSPASTSAAAPGAGGGTSEFIVGERFRVFANKVLGSGGFGTVYRALDEDTGAWVAVKVSHSAFDPNSPAASELAREVEFLTTLAHPAVVRVFGFFPVPRPSLVLEWLPGGTAADVAKAAGGRVGTGIVKRYGAAVAGALAYLHEHNVVHRDVKPANILVGADGAAKLSDFGLCKQLATEASGSAGMTGSLAGTALYLPPEVVEGRRPGPPADVWAFCATLLQLLIGCAPWAWDADLDVTNTYPVLFRIGTAAASGHRPFTPEQATAAGVPVAWWELLSRGFAPVPGERPTAEELRVAIEALPRA